MGGEQLAVEVGDGDPVVIPARLVDVLGDGGPDEALGGVVGAAGSPRTPRTARTVGADRGWLRPTRMTVGVPWPGM